MCSEFHQGQKLPSFIQRPDRCVQLFFWDRQQTSFQSDPQAPPAIQKNRSGHPKHLREIRASCPQIGIVSP